MEIWLPKLLPLLRILALAAVGFGLVVFFAQRWIAFPGAFFDSPRATPTVPDGVEQVWLETDFGRVEGWLFSAEGDGPHPAIIYAHGNGELIEHWAREMGELADAGVSALAVEFPGYGHSAGKPGRATIRQTFAEAFDRLGARPDIDAGRIVAYGRSMGGGAAGDLARDRPVAALILQSTFSSTMAMARTMLVPGFLVRDRFDNVAAVRDFDGPVLLMHGPGDDVVPFANAERLRRAREGLEVTPIDCAHNDCARVWSDIRANVVTFLRDEGLLETS